MNHKRNWKWTYKVVRSVLFSAVIFIAAIYVLLYVLLSIPAVQNDIRKIAEEQLSVLFTSRLTIEKVTIYPFNEVVVEGVELMEPQPAADGTTPRVARIDRLGAGISLTDLLIHRKITITYAELVGLDGSLRQEKKDGPLNIQFLIDAFAPKDKNKPPTQFDLKIRNIVIRKSKVKLYRPWLNGSKKFPNVALLEIDGMNADVALPRLSNEEIDVDLRRLEFNLRNYVKIDCIKGLINYAGKTLTVKDLEIDTHLSQIKISDTSLPVGDKDMIAGILDKGDLAVRLSMPKITPSEFAGFYPPLANLNQTLTAEISAHGNKHSVTLNNLDISTLRQGSELFALSVQDAILDFDLLGGERELPEIPFDNLEVKKLKLYSASSFTNALSTLIPEAGKGRDILRSAGNIDLNLEGKFSPHDGSGNVDLRLLSDLGNLMLKGDIANVSGENIIKITADSERFNFGRLLATNDIGEATFSLDADVTMLRKIFNTKLSGADEIQKMFPSARIALNVPAITLKGYPLSQFQADINKNGSGVEGNITCNDRNFDFAIDGNGTFAGIASTVNLNLDIRSFHPYIFSYPDHSTDFTLSGEGTINLRGSNPDNLQGSIDLNDLNFTNLRDNKEFALSTLSVESHISEESSGGRRTYDIYSDWLEGSLNGHFQPSRLPFTIMGMLAESFPSLISAPKGWKGVATEDYVSFDLRIFKDGNWNKIFNIPVTLPTDVVVTGDIDGAEKVMSLDVDAPFIVQGKDKLIRDTRLTARLWEGSGSVDFGVTYPTKKGDLTLEAEVRSQDTDFGIDLNFNPDGTKSFYGQMAIEASVGQALKPLGRCFDMHILPSKLYLNGSEWDVADAQIRYFPTATGPQATVDGFRVSHGRQFVAISGAASTSEEDVVAVQLSEIDLDYIFDTLNINYVKFGGLATGQAVGKALFSKNPQAETTRLFVKDLSYNQSVLGDGELHGVLDMAQKRVGITADVSEENRRVALIDGGIWIGRDSLSFSLDADKVRIGFLQPFMAAFSSGLKGRASGNALLYGTFSDIDMKGRLFADTISLKVDYTNVTYCGSDSVIIDPGHIRIPSFTLRDQYGNTAKLSGELTHRYFHEPEFDFRVTNARNLLLYDTNAKMNPRWYGRIFGSGSGQILGRGNSVGITADMTTQSNSVFTLELLDQEEAAQYSFLTFTDKRKEAMEAEAVVELTESERIMREFQKKQEAQKGPESVFWMDIRASITPATQLNLIMDPASGDKIKARGEGAMNLSYRSDTDEMKVLGKYVLEEGVYNFSLQDIILRDFIIKRGSSISFNGDPMAGLLDIHAAYRVNTSLTDLDQSFSTDRDLNRTNVPVDAMLNVTGEMQHPDISFDIQLPTLNEEVAQKVRNIISSEEMMNMQIIYLLAINRFYTPEYMGGTSGGEWAAVASSTISSQLSNILGNITDKFSLAPSFRSDKGDFSDLEVDVALSSRLFNNRLLINGNFGYRDPSTSSTTFIGDFDIEYLLNNTGNWRLKAYNHFNDQNYYLKSALTTQGVGIIWRRDFTHILGIGKKKEEAPDTISR